MSITQVRERIVTEDVYSNFSVHSPLYLSYICSVEILPQTRVMNKKEDPFLVIAKEILNIALTHVLGNVTNIDSCHFCLHRQNLKKVKKIGKKFKMQFFLLCNVDSFGWLVVEDYRINMLLYSDKRQKAPFSKSVPYFYNGKRKDANT